MRKRWMWMAPLGFLGVLVLIAIGGLIVEQLWNWLLPPLFGWRLITFWQALALLVLCRVLFGGIGAGRAARSNVRRNLRHRMTDRMVERVAERWEHMTPEERERFQQGLRARCGFPPAAGETKSQ